MVFQNVTHFLPTSVMMSMGLALLPPSLAGEGWGGGSSSHLTIPPNAVNVTKIALSQQQQQQQQHHLTEKSRKMRKNRSESDEFSPKPNSNHWQTLPTTFNSAPSTWLHRHIKVIKWFVDSQLAKLAAAPPIAKIANFASVLRGKYLVGIPFAIAEIAAKFAKCQSDNDDTDDISDIKVFRMCRI